jgi:hypothetical protein
MTPSTSGSPTVAIISPAHQMHRGDSGAQVRVGCSMPQPASGRAQGRLAGPPFSAVLRVCEPAPLPERSRHHHCAIERSERFVPRLRRRLPVGAPWPCSASPPTHTVSSALMPPPPPPPPPPHLSGARASDKQIPEYAVGQPVAQPRRERWHRIRSRRRRHHTATTTASVSHMSHQVECARRTAEAQAAVCERRCRPSVQAGCQPHGARLCRRVPPPATASTPLRRLRLRRRPTMPSAPHR